MFIAICGIDGSGKSTQVKLLAGWLKKNGHEVLETAEPTHALIGRIVWHVLREHTDVDPKSFALLFMADRIEHQKPIKNALDAGIFVLTDRYFWETYAYQGAEGVDIEWMRYIQKDMRVPDLTIILDLDPKISMKRLKTADKYEKVEFLTKVRRNFLSLAKKEKLKVIKANGTKLHTHRAIVKTVEAAMKAKGIV